MKSIINNRQLALWIAMLICLIDLALIGCGGKNSQPEAEKGELRVRLVWQSPKNQLRSQLKPPSDNVCVDFHITGIRIRVKNPSGSVAVESTTLPCGDRNARLDGIKAQKGYTVEVQGFVDDQVLWLGQTKNVEVVANQNTGPVNVTMNFKGDAATLPSASLLPADSTTQVATDSHVTVRFNQAMVKATINERTIRVSHGDQPVSGVLTYNPETFEVIFKPDQELAVSTTYTITVTSDVMDVRGQTLAQGLSAQFTTSMVWYVDGEQVKSGSGKNWEEAFTSIAEAVDAAGNDDQIWVRQGTYKPTAQIVIDKSVRLLGGFEGTETQHHKRDWTVHKTVVDGQKKRRCFYIKADAVIDGFTLTRGNPLQPVSEAVENSKGGAIYIEKASPRIANTVFTENTAFYAYNSFGGALVIELGNPSIIRCTFKDNRSSGDQNSNGGAIYNYGGGPEISDCIFTNNKSECDNIARGGAIFNDRPKAITKISNCLFDTNMASGIFNKASGGAIVNEGGELEISACRFWDNIVHGMGVVEGYGGALENFKSSVKLVNNIFYANVVNLEMYQARETGSGYGGAIANLNSSVDITNCTISSNAVRHVEANPGEMTNPTVPPDHSNGGAVDSRSSSKVTIVNSILWANRAVSNPEIHSDESASTTVSYSDVDQDLPEGDHNIRQNPRLGAELHLSANSLCIGRAVGGSAPETDIDGEPRSPDGSVDMGADQFVDSDKDQIPDFWQTRYHVGSPKKDDDEDGLSNLDEYHLDTPPNKPQQLHIPSLKGHAISDGRYDASDSAAYISSRTRVIFAFDVSGSKPVKRACLRLSAHLTDSYDEAIGRIQLWDVSIPYGTLAADIDGQLGIDIYEDLGGGTPYGEFVVNTFDDDGTVLDIQLNQAALDAINTAISESKAFILGLSMPETSRFGNIHFSGTDEIRQLVLDEE